MKQKLPACQFNRIISKIDKKSASGNCVPAYSKGNYQQP